MPSNEAPLLPRIQSPADLKRLAPELRPRLCAEIRDALIRVTSTNGGHLGPNLGVVELSVALHLVFDTPADNFVFDVAHQGYVHKLLTGRNDERFEHIRKSDGYSGFLYRSESPHDCYGAGHAGTALSAALGMAVARDRLGGSEHVVAVLGDAAFTCGITMEALNNLASSTRRLIIVLNDNKWSIARNVGAMARYLNELITNPVYNRIHDDLESFLRRVPGGDSILRFGALAKEGAKNMVVPSVLFEEYGCRYLGPVDGHDVDLLVKNLEFAKHAESPVVLHVLTVKGKGYDVAIDQPERFHGTSPFDRGTGSAKPTKAGTPANYQDVFGSALVRFATEDRNIVGITAAMPSGTGLTPLAEALPKQFFDVGIAEEHAVLFAAGMATKGLHPVCAIYSTFVQRAFDCIVHDVCLQNLPVTFCLDRAGLSPNDGPTHHGLFDIAFLRCIPNTILMQPKDEDELVDMLHTALATPSPTFIRYPRGAGTGATIKARPAKLEIGRAQSLREGSDIVIWALGSMVQYALALADRLTREEGLSVGVINARFAKPLDEGLLQRSAVAAALVVTMEDHAVTGGFGSAVLEFLHSTGVKTPVERIGWPDRFVEHGSSVEILRASCGLSPNDIAQRVSTRFRGIRDSSVEVLT
ncbi:1-deoxy-D-xylulose-5-phosphate synthase [Opitutales bacterium ASA1]|uniref:1-deoxy-D-xylulose-5-phosphate synthase n=1 Tax=Congregicoccus parvus TaxID=3081749 RepID=UPI002B32082C|nr:1-deoxy-D-xylulose-5-phosphate synthase [Opitutales bacterium ASA1]